MRAIIDCFKIEPDVREMISLVGGGGKTTTIFKLAAALKQQNKKVLITTTTAVYNPEKELYDNIVVLDRGETVEENWESGSITVLGRTISEENKLLGVNREFIDNIYSRGLFDFILVEADGSKRKPIKAPDFHEPVIPSFTSKTIGVIGMDSLGKTIDEDTVHRPLIFSKVTNSKIGGIITEDTVVRLILSKEGLFKGTPVDSERYLLLNKADSELQIRQANEIAEKLKGIQLQLNGIIAGSMKHERIRCI